MMRQIKFRAWDIRNKKYYTPVFLAETEVHAYVGHYGLDCVGDISEFIIEQYTGLKDKHGVEIYEGDVVKVFDINIVGCVVYDSSRASFFIEIDEDEAEILWYYQESFEVIGNIHEEEK